MVWRDRPASLRLWASPALVIQSDSSSERDEALQEGRGDPSVSRGDVREIWREETSLREYPVIAVFVWLLNRCLINEQLSLGSIFWPVKTPEKMWALLDVVMELNIPFVRPRDPMLEYTDTIHPDSQPCVALCSDPGRHQGKGEGIRAGLVVSVDSATAYSRPSGMAPLVHPHQSVLISIRDGTGYRVVRCSRRTRRGHRGHQRRRAAVSVTVHLLRAL